MEYIIVQTGHLKGEIKPATRPKNDGSQLGAIWAAARVSAKHGCPMYVYLCYSGFGASHAVTYRKPECEKFIKVDGREVTFYSWPPL